MASKLLALRFDRDYNVKNLLERLEAIQIHDPAYPRRIGIRNHIYVRIGFTNYILAYVEMNDGDRWMAGLYFEGIDSIREMYMINLHLLDAKNWMDKDLITDEQCIRLLKGIKI